MNVKKGEVYICLEPYCGAEIEVIRGAHPICEGGFDLRCCCGREMVLKDTEKGVDRPATVGAAA